MCQLEAHYRMLFHSILQNYAEYKDVLSANASKRRDELGDVLWSCLESKLSGNEKKGDERDHLATDRSPFSALAGSTTPKATERGSLSKAADNIAVAALPVEKGNSRPSKGHFFKGGTFGELIRDDEQGFKSEMLLLNSWQPESKSGDIPRSCHMQTMKFKNGKAQGDVKMYWNKRKPPG